MFLQWVVSNGSVSITGNPAELKGFDDKLKTFEGAERIILG